MAWALWITGIPGSGKTTVANELARLVECRVLCLDDFRKTIVPKPKYTPEEREFVYTKLAEMGKQLVDQGVNVVFDATDNKAAGRKKCRQEIERFAVVQLECSLGTAEQREKGREDKPGIHELYERAKRGEIKLPGVSEVYVREEKPEVVIDTESTGSRQAAEKIVREIEWIG